MKSFIKYALASAVGVLIVMIVMTLTMCSSLISLALSGDTEMKAKDNSVMVLSLAGNVEECSADNPFGELMGESSATIGLKEMMEAIDKAKDNDNIKGIFIEAGNIGFDAPASAQALRNKLVDFKKGGKWIVSYADTYTQMAYYVCSVADEIYLNPKGLIDWHGLSSQPMFFKDLLAKFGVKVQLAKVGKYKSAPEMLTADGMSEPNREQVTAYINGTWSEILTAVAKSRGLTLDQLNEYADKMMAFEDPDTYIPLKLADKLLYADEVKGEIKARLGIDDDDEINHLSMADMANIKGKKNNASDRIAIYYAYGDVVDTAPTGVTSNGNCIAGDKVSKDLEDLAADDDVKAVVLRMNSGGGSAYASEQIWHAMMKLKEKKPVVVSMGGMAASGGYYISCPADYIFAESTTLTGSIGIFGMFPDLSGLLTEKLGVKFDEVKTNKHSAFGTMARPFNAEEMAILDAHITRGYELFRQRVADGRGMTTAQVEEIAQGRVWIGSDALGVKLVDELGGLDKAILKAASLAELTEYGTDSYPAAQDWLTQLLAGVSNSKDNLLDEEMKAALGDYYKPFMMLKNINNQNAIQARMPYQLIIK